MNSLEEGSEDNTSSLSEKPKKDLVLLPESSGDGRSPQRDTGNTYSSGLQTSSITVLKSEQRGPTTRARVSRTPVSVDKALFHQIRAVVPSKWEEKKQDELQGLTTGEVSEVTKSLESLKYTGQKRDLSISGSKASIIGRILA